MYGHLAFDLTLTLQMCETELFGKCLFVPAMFIMKSNFGGVRPVTPPIRSFPTSVGCRRSAPSVAVPQSTVAVAVGTVGQTEADAVVVALVDAGSSLGFQRVDVSLPGSLGSNVLHFRRSDTCSCAVG